MNARSARYNENNKARRAIRDAKRAKKTGGVRRAFSVQIKRELLRKQNGYCACCFEIISSIEAAQVDHMTPVEKGGADDETNLLLAHPRCNQEKYDKTLEQHWEWRVKIGRDSENLGRLHGLIK
jgi:5-methylcytosine-specific restriction endonuclease McrA